MREDNTTSSKQQRNNGNLILNKNILPPFLNIECVVFGTEIKERTWREIFTSFERDFT